MSIDRHFAPALLREIDLQMEDGSPAAQPRDGRGLSVEDRAIWAKAAVVKASRESGVDVAISDDTAFTLAALKRALLHRHPSVWLTAVAAVCKGTGLLVSTLPTEAEYALLRLALPLATHDNLSSSRHDLRTSLAALLQRCRAVYAHARRQVAAAKKQSAVAQELLESEAEAQTAARLRQEAIASAGAARESCARVGSIGRWLLSFLLDQLYPGAPFLREMTVLELFHLATTVFPSDTAVLVRSEDVGDAVTREVAEPVSESWIVPGEGVPPFKEVPFFATVWNAAAVNALFSLFNSSWVSARTRCAFCAAHAKAPAAMRILLFIC